MKTKISNIWLMLITIFISILFNSNTTFADAPVITEGDSISVTMSEDGNPTPFILTLNATDADIGDTLTWSISISSPATNGTASVSGSPTGTSQVISYTPTANWNGSDSFVVQVSDGLGGTDTITVNVTVSPRNDAPNNTAVPVVSGTAHVGSSLSTTTGTWNDTTDQTPGNLTYTYQWQRADDAGGSNLTDIGGATGSSYTLVMADNGKYTRVRVRATDDGEGLPATASTDSFSTYTHINNAVPVITEGASTTVTMSEDGSPTAFGLTLNATDTDSGDTITWSISGAATNGTASVSGSPTGTSQVISYTPTANWNGSDSFVVQVSDGLGGTDTITVNVTVSPRNDAPNNTAVPVVSGTAHVGSSLSTTTGTWNDTTDQTPGNLTYTYQWQRADDAGGSNLTDIGGATGSSYTLVMADNGKYTRVRVRATDDGEGLPATASTDSFSTYTHINNAVPVITEGASTTVTMSEDGSPTAFGLTLNATDTDSGDTITWSISGAATNGTASVSGSPTGTSQVISYTPTANWNGSDSFVVQVSDGLGGTDTITVNVTVSPRNDAPNNTAVPVVSGTAHVGSSLSTTTGTWNDTTDQTPGNLTYTYQWQRADDAGGSNLTDIGGATGSSYTLVMADNGKYTRVRVRATDDGEGLPATASTDSFSTYTHINNAVPVITEGASTTVTMSEDGSPTAFGLTLNATDTDSGDTITWSISGAATNGTASVSGSPTGTSQVISYTPTANWNGSDSFVVQVSDGLGGTDTITVNVTVSPRNDAPNNTAVPVVSGTAHVGSSLSTTTGTWNDTTDQTPGNLTYTYQWQRADDAGGSNLTDIGGATGSSYTLVMADNGKYTRVRVRATDDGEGLPATASTDSFSTYTHINNAVPVITEGASTTVTMSEDGSPTAFGLTLNATDTDSGDTITWSISGAATNGTASVSGSPTGTSQVISYTPTANWNGSDSFVVQVSDGLGGTDTITVNVTVSPRNDAPNNTAVPVVSGTAHVGSSLSTTTGTWNDTTDQTPGNLTYTYQWQRADDAGGSNLTDIGGATGSSYTLVMADNGKYTRVRVRATDDGEGLPATASTDSFSTYTHINNAVPVITEGASTTVTMSEDGSPTAFGLTLNATDTDSGDTITWSISGAATNGTASVSGSPTGTSQVISYTPTANWNGSDSFVVQVSDGLGGTDTITVNVTVSSVNDEPTLNVISNISINEDGGTQTVNLTGIDEGGGVLEDWQNLNITATSDTPTIIPNPVITYVQNSATGTLTFTPVANANTAASGPVTITVNVLDNGTTANGGDNQLTRTFTVTITPINDMPYFSNIGNQTVNEDAGAQTVPNWATGINDGDPFGVFQVLTFNVSADNPSLFSVQPAVSSTTGQLTYTPASNAYGTTTVSVTLTDDDIAGGPGSALTTAVQQFTITINAVNDVPTLNALSNMVINENAVVSTVNLAGIDEGGGTFEDSQSLTITATSSHPTIIPHPTITYVQNSATGTLTFTPVANTNTAISGPITITVTVKDDGGTANGGVDTVVRTFTVTINPVNVEPSFTLIDPNQVVLQGSGPKTVANWASDINDGDPEIAQILTFHVLTNSNPSVFSVLPLIASDGTLTFTPANNANGIATLTINLSDNGGTANGGHDTSPSQTFTIKVQGAPVIQVTPTSFSYEVNQGSNVASTTFNLKNANLGTYEAVSLNYTITNNSGGWLTCSTSGTLASNGNTNINVSFDTTALTSNTYEAYITITDPNALNNPVKIYVKVGVIGTITNQVGGNSDDAEEVSNGDMNLNSSDLDLGESKVGMRFSSLNIPAGSEIKSAYIIFQRTNYRNTATNLTIKGQKNIDALTFASGRWNITNRPLTNSSVAWSPTTWNNSNTYYNSPEIKTVIQEIVNQTGWASTSSLAIIITGSGLRDAVSNDGTGEEPRLVITYLPGVSKIIQTDKTSINLGEIWEGDPLDPSIFTVKNAGSGLMTYTITDNVSWLSVTPATGGPVIQADGPQTHTVNFDTAGLTAAEPYTDYIGTITVSCPDAVNNPVTIEVKLRVNKPKAVITVDPSSLAVTSHETKNAFSKKITLTNTGRDVLNYFISNNADEDGIYWIIDPAPGTLAVGESTELTIAFSSSLLEVGTYEADITIKDSFNTNVTEVYIPVSLTVEPIPLSTACGDVPVYTENLVSPAIMILLDVSGSMAWDIPVNAMAYQTPDIKTIVQAIVNRSGWQTGNDMSFIITGSGDRRAYPVEGSTYYAPLLHVEFGSGQSINVKIISSQDDASENNGDDVDVDNTTLYLGYGTTNTYNGLRFRGLQIPQGATITNAYIRFYANYTRSTTTNLTIRGHNADTSPEFVHGENTGSISDRPLTTAPASVPWSTIPSWTAPTQQPRMNIAKEALKELVTDKTISWGFGTWEGNFPHTGTPNSNYTKIHVGCRYTSEHHVENLTAEIDNAEPGGNTPLKPAMNAGLDYFGGGRPDLKYNETFVGADCQPTFVIMITDGMGNVDSTVTNVGTATQALADQGVNTVGIGFGLSPEDTEQLYKLAEISNTNGKVSAADNLFSLHKEVDAIPQPFLAQSKEELLASLRTITESIKAEVFHGSAPAPTTSVDYGDIVITAKFQPADWSGDLVATQYDSETGELTDELWSANDKMPDTIKAFIGNATGTDWETYTDTSLATDSYLCDDKGLGDIINSTPIIVENPPYFYNFNNYLRGFKYLVDRDPLVYIGSNDGAIHAFMLTDKKVGETVETYGGEEVWRFYPTAVRGNLNKALTPTEEHWDMCDENSYCHRYFVDGSPVAGDIFDGTNWRTMLVTGLREGGEAYFALDVTSGKSFDDPDDPSDFMWEFTDTELGQSWADPAITRVLQSPTGTAWAVFFGSGYKELAADQANKEAYLYGIEAHNKGNLWKNASNISVNKIKISSTTLTNDALAPPMPADLEGDYLTDSLYVGNLYGIMYRAKNIGKDMVPIISKLYDSETSDQSTPIRAKADYAYTSDANIIRVYFGTGIYERQVDKYSSEQQFFFGLKDNYTAHKTYKHSDADLAKLTAEYVTDDVTGKTFRNITGTNNNKDSWVIGLDNFSPDLLGSERVITQPLVVAGIVFFASFIPDEDVCEGNGRSWLFAVDYETGLPPTEPVFDINGDGVINEQDVVKSGDHTFVPAAVSLGAGQPSKPVLHKDTLFVTTTGGGLASLKVNLSKQLTNVTSWSEK